MSQLEIRNLHVALEDGTAIVEAPDQTPEALPEAEHRFGQEEVREWLFAEREQALTAG